MFEGKKVIYVNYFDTINSLKVKAIMAVCSELIAKEKPDVLYFLFASNGGEVDPGIVLYNFLKALPVEIVMHNIGVIDSIATVIFMAGIHRFANSHSSFLFHGTNTQLSKDATLSLTQLKEIKSSIEQMELKIGGILTSNTKLTLQDITDLFQQGESKNVTFAKDKGIISDVKEASIPRDAQFVTITLN